MLVNGVNATAGTDLEVDILDVKLKGVTRRRERPRKIIIDWSGNEMNAEEYGRFLEKSKVGCHLFIDAEGSITQYADLWAQRVMRHPNTVLELDAIWIVLQNRGAPPADSRVSRGSFAYRWGNEVMPVLGATADQIDALIEVVALICESLDIEPCLPRVDGVPARRKIGTKVATNWQGILLASHISPSMSPGPGVLDALAQLEDAFFSEEEDEDEDEEEDEGEDGEDGEADGDYEPPSQADFDRDFPDLA